MTDPSGEAQHASRPRLPALTALRFFAALHVLIFHVAALGIHSGQGWYEAFASTGYIGVSLFFVLSGFILVYTYEGREWRAAEFWRARFARVYPAYALALLLSAPAFFYVCLHEDTPAHAWFRENLVACALLVPALLQAWVPGAALAWNGPAWSLSVEAFFYLTFPLLFGLLLRRERELRAIAVGAWLIGLSFPVAYVLVQPDGAVEASAAQERLFWLGALKFNPLARLPEFVIGMCAGLWFVRGAVPRRWAAWLGFAGLGAILLAVAMRDAIPALLLHNALLAPAFAASIYGLALSRAAARVMSWTPLVLLGNASYSLYLLHVCVLGWFFMPAGQLRAVGTFELWLGVLSPIALAVLVFRYVEEPARRKLRKPARGARPRAVTVETR